MGLHTNLADFLPELLIEVMGCPQPVVEFHLLRVAREVCEATDAWQEVFPTLTSSAGQSSYFLITADARGELVRLTRYTMGGDLQWARTQPRKPAAQSNERWIPARFPPDRPPFEFDAAREMVTFSEEPTGDLEFSGSMRPKLTATTLPTILRERHMETLRFGTLSRLMAMGNKDWTDRDLAEFYGQQYNAALNFDATQAARGNTRAPLRTRPSPV